MDKEEFSRRVLAAERMLYRVAKTICYADADCEDAVQEAILKAYENLHKLKDKQYFQTWLTRILINQCYEQMRKRTKLVSYEEFMSDEPAEECTHYTELYQAICRLPEKVRLAVVLHYIEGYSVEEVGQILYIAQGTVKSRLSRGRKLLHGELKSMEVDYGY